MQVAVCFNDLGHTVGDGQRRSERDAPGGGRRATKSSKTHPQRPRGSDRRARGRWHGPRRRSGARVGPRQRSAGGARPHADDPGRQRGTSLPLRAQAPGTTPARWGAVGSRYLGWWRLFRYEVRCWRGGSIADLAEAVSGPHRLTSDPRAARRILDLVASVPTPVWGRDELRAGEMWNSKSVIAWLIATAGLPTDLLQPPARGRGPGWASGLEVARREASTEVRRSILGKPPAAAGVDPVRLVR